MVPELRTPGALMKLIMEINVCLLFLNAFEKRRVSDLRRSKMIHPRTDDFQSLRLSNLRRSESTQKSVRDPWKRITAPGTELGEERTGSFDESFS
jgi:hypothetical protein